VAITNTGSENLSGLLIFRASALAGTAQPVPEASPTLLALLGTGLAAGLTHRRRQRRHT